MADQWQDTNILTAQVRDDDDDIPDDWENEPEEKPKKSDVDEKPKAPVKAPPTTKNKASKKKFTADGHASDEEFLESLKEPNREYTAEELEELQKRADLQKEELKLNMASDFIGATSDRRSLDNVNLLSKEDFLDYSFRLYNRLELLSKSEFYPEFLDNIITGLTKPLSVDTIKHMQTSLNGILLQKQKDKRPTKPPTKQVKPQLPRDRRNEYDSFLDEGVAAVDINEEYDEDNDFM